MEFRRKLISQLIYGIVMAVLFALGLVLYFVSKSSDSLILLLLSVLMVSFGGFTFPMFLYSYFTNAWKYKLLVLVKNGVSTITALSAGVKKSKEKVVKGIAFLIVTGHLAGYAIVDDAVVYQAKN